MSASDLYKAGKLQEAIDAQIQDVKASAADHNKRLFLFELLAFAGELDRARKQIDVINYGDPERDIALLAYRKCLDSELARRKLFAEGMKPQFLAPPADHVTLRLDAVNRLREGNAAEALDVLAKAAETTPVVRGLINSKPFPALRDADDLFAGILEVFSQGNYFWVPFEQIDTLAMKAPKTPRDLLWIAAHLDVRDGPSGDVFLPVLYPNSHANADDAIRLGRSTDWKGGDGAPLLGVGQHLFDVGESELSILEWRELQVLGTGA